jgi:hypothetical protein
MTGVTDKQIEQLGIAKLTPLHPEDALKKAGAVYEWYAPTTDRWYGGGMGWGIHVLHSRQARPPLTQPASCTRRGTYLRVSRTLAANMDL